LYETRTGCVSYWNYQRIKEGMSVEEVESLMGSPANPPPTVWSYGDYTPPGAPPGCKACVWGDEFFGWQDPPESYLGDQNIVIGCSNGKVISKAYRAPSF
jgi:hypothetical protein